MNVDLSLDDRMKQKKAADKAAKKKAAELKAKKAAAAVPTKGGKKGQKGEMTKPGSAASKKRGQGKKGGAGAMDVDKQMKVAAATGTAKAKRGAALDARRGLNKTGKASAADVKKAVNKAQAKVSKKASVTSGKSKRGAKGPQLKIKFSTKNLEKDTTKNMMAQIKGVMSKQNITGGPSATSKASTTGGGRRRR